MPRHAVSAAGQLAAPRATGYAGRRMNMPEDASCPALRDAPDAALMVLYGNGDREAAQMLTIRYLPRVLGFAARMLDDMAEAEDVAQEAMLRLWRIAPDWRDGEARVSTWLYRVTANLCTDRLRRRWRGTALEAAGDPPDGGPDAEDMLIAADRATALQSALARLPERQRQAVILRHLEGMTNPEIAAVMEIGVEAVESLVARGKRALGAAMSARRGELGFEDE